MPDLVRNPEDMFSHDEAHMTPVGRKPVFQVVDQVGLLVKEVSKKLDNSDKETRKLIL